MTATDEDAVRKALAEIVTHFFVKDGVRKDKNQYGHLELWWAAKSVDENPDAALNPWMLLGSAENSYALAAMGHLSAVLKQAGEALRTPPHSLPHSGEPVAHSHWAVEESTPNDGFECYFLLRDDITVGEFNGRQTDQRTRHLQDLVAAANASPPTTQIGGGVELVAVGSRVQQSKVYAGSRDGTVIKATALKFTVSWDGVTVASEYDQSYLTENSPCPIKLLAAPKPQRSVARVRDRLLQMADNIGGMHAPELKALATALSTELHEGGK